MDDKRKRYLEIALIQTTLLGDLVQDLTDVVRVQSGQLPIEHERIDLVHVVTEAVELARPLSQDQEIRLDLPSLPFAVTGDRRRLQQVVLNLIANALQHGSSEHGVDVRVRADSNAAVIEIEDYGAGIPAQHREHIFERFYRAGDHTSAAGLGVGLFLVKGIVAAHDGTIEVNSAEGHGSTFVIRLPQEEAAR
jgi:two-component system OmpR family sensor kinase